VERHLFSLLNILCHHLPFPISFFEVVFAFCVMLIPLFVCWFHYVLLFYFILLWKVIYFLFLTFYVSFAFSQLFF
jgi:hypothetical protein